MSCWSSNILRSVARDCVKECAEATKGMKKVGDRDAVYREIISKHHKRVEPSFSRLELTVMIGIVTGRVVDPLR